MQTRTQQKKEVSMVFILPSEKYARCCLGRRQSSVQPRDMPHLFALCSSMRLARSELATLALLSSSRCSNTRAACWDTLEIVRQSKLEPFGPYPTVRLPNAARGDEDKAGMQISDGRCVDTSGEE